MNKKLIVIVLVLVILVAAASYKLYSSREAGITATGTVEATRADITAKVSGYLTGLSIQAGDNLQTGALIATISRPDLQAQL